MSIAAYINTDVIVISKPQILDLRAEEYLYLIMYFTAGMTAYAWREKITLSAKGALYALVALIGMFSFGEYRLTMAVFGTYLLLYLGCRVKVIHVPFENLSYGMYIYAFPIQQIWACVLQEKQSVFLNTLLTIPCAITMAWISEKTIAALAGKIQRLLFERIHLPGCVNAGIVKGKEKYYSILEKCAVFLK